MQLTTREAVEIVLSEAAAQCVSYEPSCVRCSAVKLLCDHYGFKLSQFFDVEEV